MSSKYEQDDIPAGDGVKDNTYASRTGQSTIPVQKDEVPVEDPIDPATADTDEQLGTDPAFVALPCLRTFTSYFPPTIKTPTSQDLSPHYY